MNPDGIHRSLLAGLLSHIGLKDVRESGKKGGARPPDYLGARQTRFVIFPGSALAKKQPNAIMSAELVETSRLFARMNAAIDPAWAEPIAGDLCKRSTASRTGRRSRAPSSPTSGSPCSACRSSRAARVQFSRIDAELARELFIRHALVDGEWDSHAGVRPRQPEAARRARASSRSAPAAATS